jgi:ergothioneine biosynthesis protein EgtB
MPAESSVAARTALGQLYQGVRRRTEALCHPLAIDDYQVQSVVEVSPPKWHLAHVTWFFETFLLTPFVPGYRSYDPRFAHLFNSYYVTLGSFHPRPQRHTLSRPTVEEIYRYRAYVDEHVGQLVKRCPEADWDALAQRLTLGLHHEQQHQELLLMDIKRNFLANPLYPAYAEAGPAASGIMTALRWLEFDGGVRDIGHGGAGFCFDNETPRHRVLLQDYRLGSRLITNAEYLEFIEAGGYDRADGWLSDGWAVRQQQGWKAPLYWIAAGGAWHEMTLHGLQPLEDAAPVCHVSYYEADAFARWRGARLPTEAEWEAAVAGRQMHGNFVEAGLKGGRLHPRPAADEDDAQWLGDAWEWTASPYAPYPGFRPLAGSLGEYNGKFMVNQLVLRGGCCATPQSHMRATYRNFFYPHDRWPFTAIRLALDG